MEDGTSKKKSAIDIFDNTIETLWSFLWFCLAVRGFMDVPLGWKLFDAAIFAVVYSIRLMNSDKPEVKPLAEPGEGGSRCRTST